MLHDVRYLASYTYTLLYTLSTRESRDPLKCGSACIYEVETISCLYCRYTTYNIYKLIIHTRGGGKLLKYFAAQILEADMSKVTAQPANTGLWLLNQTQTMHMYRRDDIILHKHAKLQIYSLSIAQNNTVLAIDLWANTNAKQIISFILDKHFQISNIFDRILFPRIILNKEIQKLKLKTFIPSFGIPVTLISPPSSSINPFNLSSTCLLYTSPSPRDLSTSRMPSSA